MKSVFKIAAIVLIFLGLSPRVLSQETYPGLTANGYVSLLQSSIFERFDEEWFNENIIHNRLNVRLYAGPKVTFGMEMRNRIFTADMLTYYPGYASGIDADRGWLDMSWNVIDERSFLFNIFLDRLWIDFSGNNYQLRLGRQRINWGQAFVWNPNDVFNTYSYFDFDYPERPGSDAIRLQIYPSYSSTLEIAANIDSEDNITAAALYRFNKWGYDIQFLGGYISGSDLMLGTGWSGSLGSASFRGELSWFQPYKSFSDTTGTGLFTLGFDRSFSNNANLQFQVMYCNKPVDFNDFNELYSGNMSAKDLAFSEISLFASAQYPVTPLLKIGLSTIFYPGINGVFAGPTIDASLAKNLDFSFFWQHFKADMISEKLKLNLAFLRVKYSF